MNELGVAVRGLAIDIDQGGKVDGRHTYSDDGTGDGDSGFKQVCVRPIQECANVARIVSARFISVFASHIHTVVRLTRFIHRHCDISGLGLLTCTLYLWLTLYHTRGIGT